MALSGIEIFKYLPRPIAASVFSGKLVAGAV
jgi:hypothetical protein